MKKISIVFFGSSNYSLKCLEVLLKSKVKILGVCSIKKNNFLSDFVDLSQISKKNNIPWIYWENKKSKKVVEWIKQKEPDFIFCIGWPFLLKKNILNLPKYNCVGYHPSNVPKYRGRHPLIWSIILNLKQIYSTFFIITKYADFGPIISKRKILLNESTTSTSLYNSINQSCRIQINELLVKINKFKSINLKVWISKNTKKKGIYLRKRTYKDGIIDWRMSSESIYRLVNALNKPYPYASFYINKKEIKVKKIKIIKLNQKCEAGKIISTNNNKPVIKVADNAIQLLDYNPKIEFKKLDYLL